jgi:hypothetical protein
VHALARSLPMFLGKRDRARAAHGTLTNDARQE